jgi:adenylate kinase
MKALSKKAAYGADVSRRRRATARFILLGSPGAGKGTQAELIARQFHIPQIATGDILRKAVKEETPIGKEVQKYMQEGKLVPDAVIIQIVRERLREADCLQGYILDGFPRTVAQADALTQVLAEMYTRLDAVVSIEVPVDELVQRLSGRRICLECGESYHLLFHPPSKPGVCDRCGGRLIQRADDREETIKKRLEVYTAQTAPLKDYYRTQGLLQEINGVGSREEVFERLVQVVKGNG